MRTYEAGKCDIAVIGAGHAGIEAALASARLGLETVCFAINLDTVGNMPCNPAIGGTGKGHLVRELDALGGEMARAADEACIQYRMLNLGKGPAVHSLRAQADRRRYQEVMKLALERQERLRLIQAEVVDIGVENGRVVSVTTHTGAVWRCRAAVVATGTFLRGRTIVGEVLRDSGPDGLAPSGPLSDRLRGLGLSLRRFKTGTPPRINARSVDFSKMQLQEGDAEPEPFSFSTERAPENRARCWLTWTTPETHAIIRANLDRSPIYSGVIEGVGPRYCPSIETKVMTFPDKERHQLFIEPMGLSTEELYVQGFSSSMPEEVQVRMLHSVPGLEHAEIMRAAYAIEYDCIDPLELLPTLETRKVAGLYGAGQFNGSSGYEEAAVQGFAAGVNAALKILGRPPFVLKRSEAYIGALIDDLVTRGTNEPYRMMTSRSEYRLLLRQDNADERLTRIGYELGLVSKERIAAVEAKYAAVSAELERLERTHVAPTPELGAALEALGTATPVSGVSLAALLRRPQVGYDDLAPFDADRPPLPRAVTQQVEIRLRYEGYIKRQLRQVEEFAHMESRALPADIDYEKVPGLRTEARQKLAALRPIWRRWPCIWGGRQDEGDRRPGLFRRRGLGLRRSAAVPRGLGRARALPRKRLRRGGERPGLRRGHGPALRGARRARRAGGTCLPPLCGGLQARRNAQPLRALQPLRQAPPPVRAGRRAGRRIHRHGPLRPRRGRRALHGPAGERPELYALPHPARSAPPPAPAPRRHGQNRDPRACSLARPARRSEAGQYGALLRSRRRLCRLAGAARGRARAGGYHL